MIYLTTIDERIFKNPIERISKEDLNSIIGETESLELEFKEIDKRIKEKCLRKEKIISPLVSFLNSSRGSGLLILGIKEDRRDTAIDIRGVDSRCLHQLQSENALETFIFANIYSTPSETNKYKLKAKMVPWNNNINVYLIKIERNDSNCVYSSRITGRAYIREGRKSNGLNLNEAIDLVSKKNYSKLFVKISISGGRIRENKTSHNIHFDYMNKGAKPAEDVMIALFICSHNELDFGIEPHYRFSKDSIELKKFDLDDIKMYKYTRGYSVPHDSRSLFHYPAYPFKDFSAGSLSIRYQNIIKFKIYTLIFEKSGFTKQEFSIQLSEGEDPVIQEECENRVFKPYLTL